MLLWVDEITYTLQGEGARAGHPSTFIRFAGCNLRCPWCDQPESLTKKGAVGMTPAEILEQARPYPTYWLVLTGGEPLARDLEAFCGLARERGFLLAVETNGTFYQGWMEYGFDHVTVSPKNVAGSALAPDMRNLADEFKFVIDGEKAIEFMDEVLADAPPLTPVYLQPEWSARDQWLPLCIETILMRGKRYRLSLQTHKMVGLP